jgi:hypothetical protein
MRCWTPPLGLAALVAGSAVALGALGCTADIPVFETDDPQKEVCGGTVCFTPEHVAVRKWGAGHVSVAAWRTGSCTLPRSGVAGEALPGHGLVVELEGARPGAQVPVVARKRTHEVDGPWITLHALRVDASTGRAWADEEAVAGEATVLDLDSAQGRLRLRVKARWSSGVSSELLLDVGDWSPCPGA